MPETLWKFRYRSPLAPNRGVDEVVIKTDEDSAEEATALAHEWLATFRAHPETRFIPGVSHFVATSSAEMRALKAKASQPEPEEPLGPNPIQAASRSPVMVPANRDEMSGVGAEARPSKASGRIGA